MEVLNHSEELRDTEQEREKEVVSYEYAGCRIRVHFRGKKTLAQCIREMTERMWTDAGEGQVR